MKWTSVRSSHRSSEAYRGAISNPCTKCQLAIETSAACWDRVGADARCGPDKRPVWFRPLYHHRRSIALPQVKFERCRKNGAEKGSAITGVLGVGLNLACPKFHGIRISPNGNTLDLGREEHYIIWRFRIDNRTQEDFSVSPVEFPFPPLQGKRTFLGNCFYGGDMWAVLMYNGVSCCPGTWRDYLQSLSNGRGPFCC